MSARRQSPDEVEAARRQRELDRALQLAADLRRWKREGKTARTTLVRRPGLARHYAEQRGEIRA